MIITVTTKATDIDPKDLELLNNAEIVTFSGKGKMIDSFMISRLSLATVKP